MRLFNSRAPTPAASPAHLKGEWLQNAECPPWRCSKGPLKAAKDETQMRWSVPCQWSTERPGRELGLSFSWKSPNLIVSHFCQNQLGEAVTVITYCANVIALEFA